MTALGIVVALAGGVLVYGALKLADGVDLLGGLHGLGERYLIARLGPGNAGGGDIAARRDVQIVVARAAQAPGPGPPPVDPVPTAIGDPAQGDLLVSANWTTYPTASPVLASCSTCCPAALSKATAGRMRSRAAPSLTFCNTCGSCATTISYSVALSCTFATTKRARSPECTSRTAWCTASSA